MLNRFTGQSVAIVSDTPGTTTDPVSKAMEIPPLGPCLVTDTAGLDDEGELGKLRVEKSLNELEKTDVAVWVDGDDAPPDDEAYARFLGRCKEKNVVVLKYRRGDSVDALKEKIAALKLADVMPGLLDGLARSGDRVVCVCPIDASAPKDRLILPQVQVIRACLDLHVVVTVCQPEELSACLDGLIAGAEESLGRLLVITDSQAFGKVGEVVKRLNAQLESSNRRKISLTSFSILFARQKGDLAAFSAGIEAAKALRSGDRVLIAEGCTHHRQCNDIGTVKIPKALEKLSGKKLQFEFASGTSFPDAEALRKSKTALVVHCGGCMLTRREVLRRLAVADEAGVAVVNYGLLLAAACCGGQVF